MNRKIHIAVAGPGGVGGYLGALLARQYRNSEHTTVSFIVRPSAADTIRREGFRLITDEEDFIVHPDAVFTTEDEIPSPDYLICCVKTYDLDDCLLSLQKHLSPHTVVLPLLNGVDATERIHGLLPEVEAWEGCIYIVSTVVAPGTVKKSGQVQALHFGSETASARRLQELHTLFTQAGIDARLSDTIQTTIWEKFIFISTVASLTSYDDLPIGALLQDTEKEEMLRRMIAECIAVANANGVVLPENTAERTMKRIVALPYETTSSMQRDFRQGKRTEYCSLTAYVSEKGKILNIATPCFDKVLTGLKQKSI